MKPKTRIGLSGVIGLGGAGIIAVATGGAAIPLLLLGSTGLVMKKIASEPDYKPTYSQPDFSASNISRNVGDTRRSVNNLLETGRNRLEDNRRNYNNRLVEGVEIANQQLASLSQSQYENVSKINIFPEARRKVLGLRIGRKTMEVGIEYG